MFRLLRSQASWLLTCEVEKLAPFPLQEPLIVPHHGRLCLPESLRGSAYRPALPPRIERPETG
jgi:hypothetical protein